MGGRSGRPLSLAGSTFLGANPTIETSTHPHLQDRCVCLTQTPLKNFVFTISYSCFLGNHKYSHFSLATNLPGNQPLPLTRNSNYSTLIFQVISLGTKAILSHFYPIQRRSAPQPQRWFDP